MITLEAYIRNAKFLVNEMDTIWNEYDFDERSSNSQSRIPKIRFNADVTVMLDEVHCIKQKDSKYYVREYQVKYEGNVYIFDISAHIDDEEIVRCFIVTAYIPAADGKGGRKKLFSQNLR